MEMCSRLCSDATDVIQSVRAGGEGSERLEAHISLYQMCVVSGYVWRIGSDNIEALTMQGGKPVALRQLDIAEAQSPCVEFRYFQCGRLAQGRAWAMLKAIAPLPVPRSSTRQVPCGKISCKHSSTSSSVSGRGIRVAVVTLNFSP